MKLPGSDISIMDVRNCIGCPSTDLGTLCAKAETGGEGGYAFKIKENGYGTSIGSLITDSDGLPSALPYWNIWSNSSPGRWVLPLENNTDPLMFELKRDSSNRYRFALGDFRNYDHEATPPMAPNAVVNLRQNQSTTSGYDVVMKCDTGSYDWTKVTGATHYKVVVFDGAFDKFLFQGNIAPLGSTTATYVTVKNVNTNGVYTKDYDTGIFLCGKDGYERGLIPLLGKFTLNVIGVTTMRVNAEIKSKGSIYRVMGKAVTAGFGEDTITCRGVVNNAVRQLSGYYLKSVYITCANANGAIVYESTRDVDYRDDPISYVGFKEQIGEVGLTVYIPQAAWKTITSSSCAVNAVMRYE